MDTLLFHLKILYSCKKTQNNNKLAQANLIFEVGEQVVLPLISGDTAVSKHLDV